jgi:hypothetical protein
MEDVVVPFLLMSFGRSSIVLIDNDIGDTAGANIRNNIINP